MSTKIHAERRTADETRGRLVSSASFLFNRDGYHGTDSNKIARHAGFAAGTFYNHFRDKKAAFLASYQRAVTNEWDAIAAMVASSKNAQQTAAGLVALLVETQRSWQGFRASLGTLAADPDVRQIRRDQRARHLELLASLRDRTGAARKPREQDAVLLFTLERTCDALADGEATDLRLSERTLTHELEALIEREISKAR